MKLEPKTRTPRITVSGNGVPSVKSEDVMRYIAMKDFRTAPAKGWRIEDIFDTTAQKLLDVILFMGVVFIIGAVGMACLFMP